MVVGLVGLRAVMRVLRWRSDASPESGWSGWHVGTTLGVMGATVTVNDVLDGHVQLDIECLDRIYFNGYVPNLQVLTVSLDGDHGVGIRHWG